MKFIDIEERIVLGIFAIVVITGCACIIFLLSSLGRSFNDNEHTKAACRYGSEITKKGFIGTQFENFDFYQSCLENSCNTGPYSRGCK